MNITPISSVSFRGDWEMEDVIKKTVPFEQYEDRIWTYRPDADEKPEEIQKAIAAKKAEFVGDKQITEKTLGGGDYFTNYYYKNIVEEKPDKRFLSPKKTAELQQEQKTLAKRLREITEQLTFKPKVPRKSSIRVR